MGRKIKKRREEQKYCRKRESTAKEVVSCGHIITGGPKQREWF